MLMNRSLTDTSDCWKIATELRLHDGILKARLSSGAGAAPSRHTGHGLCPFSHSTEAVMRMHDLDYRDGTVMCRGVVAYDDTASGKRPGALVFHEGLGLGEHIMERARKVAKLGYVALAAARAGVTCG